MVQGGDETTELIGRIDGGSQTAFEELFGRHRQRLKRAISLRMDRRLTARVDASDVVQEAYLEAANRFEKYLEKPDMPFYLWLRWIGRDKVIQHYRRHLGAEKRGMDRETPLLPAATSAQFVKGLLAPGETPTQELAATEWSELLRQALDGMDPRDRDAIVYRHFEQLTGAETAALLGISEAAARKRYIRAVEKLRKKLLRMGLTAPGDRG